MNIPIITRDSTGLFLALVNMGYSNFDSINWARMPMRINGVWRAVVRHG
jgi:hypothetical protein